MFTSLFWIKCVLIAAVIVGIAVWFETELTLAYDRGDTAGYARRTKQYADATARLNSALTEMRSQQDNESTEQEHSLKLYVEGVQTYVEENPTQISTVCPPALVQKFYGLSEDARARLNKVK